MSFARRAKTHLLRATLKIPLLDGIILKQLDSRSARVPWRLRHPFDVEHGVQTSGMVQGALLAKAMETGYGAAQPSIIRQAIEQLPDRAKMTFVDLGCGKGRPCLVATEYEFRHIVGVELARSLARIARRNASVFRKRFPGRKPIRIITGDALAYTFPRESFALYLYNPFGRAQVAQLVERLTATLQGRANSIFVIYHHPVWADVLDASPAFKRYHAADIPYAPTEIGYGPDRSDTVVIWQAHGGAGSLHR